MTKNKLMNGATIRTIKISDGRLEVHPLYQRKLDRNHVADIVREFDVRCLKLVVVSERDGRLWVVDGNHTRHILAEKGYKEFHALVYTGLTAEDEGKIFYQSSKNQKKISGTQEFKTAIFCKDPLSVTTLKIMEDAGLTCIVTLKEPETHMVGHHNEFDFKKGFRTMTTLCQESEYAFRRMCRAMGKGWKVGGRMSKMADNSALLKGIHQFLRNNSLMTDKNINRLFLLAQPEDINREANDLVRSHVNRPCRNDSYFAKAVMSLAQRHGLLPATSSRLAA